MNFKSLLKKYWPLLLILLIGGSLRLYGLLQNPISLYSDEVDIGYQVISLLKTGCDYTGHCFPIQFHSFSDIRTPLPIYFTALIHLVGVPLDYSIRLSSVIFGILGIFATYLLIENLASEKLFNLKKYPFGIIGASILALIPWHLTFSRIGFELTPLYFFVTFGVFLFTEYLIKGKIKLLYLSFLFLGLTPMIYSTAKMAVLFYPFILLSLPGSLILFKNYKLIATSLTILFLPLIILFISGGADSRFQYISIFTDPTATTAVNFMRQQDSGPIHNVGASPSILTKLFHNKPLFYVNNLSNNFFNLLSTQFLFTKGDPNLRHSPENWGMLYRSLLPILPFGVYILIRYRRDRLILFLGLQILVAMFTSAITRDGGEHASRSFMMLLPLVIIGTIGLAYLKDLRKILFYIACFTIFFESVFFLHEYWIHYPLASEGSFSAGMKELIRETEKFPGQPIVISPKNENPLIFYLYYTDFDPRTFQNFVKTNTLFNNTEGKNNLDGNRIGNTNLYIASLIDINHKPVQVLPNAVYYLTWLEFYNSKISNVATVSDIIKLPSGKPLYYEIHY